MKPFDFPLFADENIDPEVIEALVHQEKNITAAVSVGLGGKADIEIMRHAYQQGRVIVTHDSDFGTLAIRNDEPYVGIIYLRPGHISSKFVLEIIASVQSSAAEPDVPYILVAERKGTNIRLRIRQSTTW
jgi:predicted nuclease of predicted toxin-antitoxin system